MRKQLAVGFVLAIAVALLLAATPAAAKGSLPDEGITVFNEDYTLAAGDRVEGDLVVVNGDVTLEIASRVEGSVFVWSGDVEVEGTVESDVVVTQGDLYLGDDAIVEGDVVCSWSCDLDREDGAHVDGNVVEGVPISLPRIVSEGGPELRVPATTGALDSGMRSWLNWLFRVLRAFASVVVLAIVAGLVAAILPRHTAQVGRTALAAPGHSVGIGILTVIAGVMLIVGLAVTICFSPLAIAVGLALGAGSLLGWIGIGALVGGRLLQAAKAREPAPMWTAALGTLLMSMVTMFVGAVGVPCLDVIASVVSAIVGFIGLGAVVLTRFGTRPYEPKRPATVTGAVGPQDADEEQPVPDELLWEAGLAEPESGEGDGIEMEAGVSADDDPAEEGPGTEAEGSA